MQMYKRIWLTIYVYIGTCIFNYKHRYVFNNVLVGHELNTGIIFAWFTLSIRNKIKLFWFLVLGSNHNPFSSRKGQRTNNLGMVCCCVVLTALIKLGLKLNVTVKYMWTGIEFILRCKFMILVIRSRTQGIPPFCIIYIYKISKRAWNKNLGRKISLDY